MRSCSRFFPGFLSAFALFLFVTPAQTAPVLSLFVDSVKFGAGSRTNNITLSGADFSFTAVTQATGFGTILAQYGENLGHQIVTFDNTQPPLFGYFSYLAQINEGGINYSAKFTGHAQAAFSGPLFAPYGTGSSLAYTTVQGSFTACLLAGTANPNAPCDPSLPTYMLAFSLPGYIYLDFTNIGNQLSLQTIGATAPVPEPSSLLLLLAAGMIGFVPLRRKFVRWEANPPRQGQPARKSDIAPLDRGDFAVVSVFPAAAKEPADGHEEIRTAPPASQVSHVLSVVPVTGELPGNGPDFDL
jgi:hypothetical protein